MFLKMLEMDKNKNQVKNDAHSGQFEYFIISSIASMRSIPTRTKVAATINNILFVDVPVPFSISRNHRRIKGNMITSAILNIMNDHGSSDTLQRFSLSTITEIKLVKRYSIHIKTKRSTNKLFFLLKRKKVIINISVVDKNRETVIIRPSVILLILRYFYLCWPFLYKKDTPGFGDIALHPLVSFLLQLIQLNFSRVTSIILEAM